MERVRLLEEKLGEQKMKKENVILTNCFFLLSNGDVVYWPDGIKRNELINGETEAKVMAFEYKDDGIKRRCPVRIEACSDTPNLIEEKEKIFFVNHKHKINYFYRNLKKIDPGYQPEEMYEKVQELIDANRIRIVRRWKIYCDKELRKIYTNIFDI